MNVESAGAEEKGQLRQHDRETTWQTTVSIRNQRTATHGTVSQYQSHTHMPTYHHRSYPLKVPGSQHILKDMIITALLPGVCFRVLVDKLQWNVLFTNQMIQDERIKRNICMFCNFISQTCQSILSPYCLTLGGLDSTLILLLTSDLIRLCKSDASCLKRERAKVKS